MSTDTASTDAFRGAPSIVLRGDDGSACVLTLHGAHVVSWLGPSGDERIFTSARAVLDGATAIRGGIPICFPQFSDLGPCAKSHGFARCAAWEATARSASSATLRLRASAPEWPHAHETTYEVACEGDGGLRTTLRVTNVGEAALRFTTALHTYFRVGDVAKTRVVGASGLTYLDNLDGRRAKVDEDACVTFAGEVDRIYKGAPDVVRIVDESAEPTRAFEITKSKSLPDAVVWNPWIEKSRKMSDFGDDEYREMVCVEVAGIDEIVVEPGATWEGSQTIRFSSD